MKHERPSEQDQRFEDWAWKQADRYIRDEAQANVMVLGPRGTRRLARERLAVELRSAFEKGREEERG